MIAETQTVEWSLLREADEPLAAGFMERLDASPLWRMARGLQEFFTQCPVPQHGGEALYPCSGALFATSHAVQFHYSASLTTNFQRLEQKRAAATPAVANVLGALSAYLREYPSVSGYTHSIINFGRVLSEGLDSYEARLRRHLSTAERRADAERSEFYAALLVLLEGIRTFHQRACDHLATQATPQAMKVLAALRRVPFQPATSFYEAMVATNFLYYLDGCDDLGRFDQDLWPYLAQDLASGAVTREEALEWVVQLFANVDRCNGWNAALGGTAPDGSQGCNELTLLCLQAIKGRRRPNVALRLRRDTPEEYWDAALEALSGGSGLPALYNEEEYLRGIAEAHLGVTAADLPHFAFGGCTELMVHGRSNVGSLDDTLNVLLTLEDALYRHLPESDSFAEFLRRYKADLSRDIEELTQRVNGYQASKAQWQPQPLRTLLVDDCIENGREFNAGGARYNWSVINLAGLPNVYDSLAAVKRLVFEERALSAGDLLELLRTNFAGQEAWRRRLQAGPHFGNDDPYVDDLAAEVATHIFTELQRHSSWRGGRYLGSCLMFVTYGHFGQQVGATPDGRLANSPVGDSAGAYQGRDQAGPTALLRSVTRVPHYLAPGTLVHNIRFTRRLFDDPETRQQVKALIRTYFALGGMQLQINVVDQRVLRDALEHPERYGDLIVRMGGYSEYFNNLTRDLQLSLLQRIEHN